MTVDEALAEIAEIERQLTSLTSSAPERDALERRRIELRREVALAVDRAKPRPVLVAELEHLERRLRDLESVPIKRTIGEASKKWITDPSAYSHDINERIRAASQDERATIEARIAIVRQVLDEGS